MYSRTAPIVSTPTATSLDDKQAASDLKRMLKAIPTTTTTTITNTITTTSCSSNSSAITTPTTPTPTALPIDKTTISMKTLLSTKLITKTIPNYNHNNNNNNDNVNEDDDGLKESNENSLMNHRRRVTDIDSGEILHVVHDDDADDDGVDDDNNEKHAIEFTTRRSLPRCKDDSDKENSTHRFPTTTTTAMMTTTMKIPSSSSSAETIETMLLPTTTTITTTPLLTKFQSKQSTSAAGHIPNNNYDHHGHAIDQIVDDVADDGLNSMVNDETTTTSFGRKLPSTNCNEMINMTKNNHTMVVVVNPKTNSNVKGHHNQNKCVFNFNSNSNNNNNSNIIQYQHHHHQPLIENGESLNPHIEHCPENSSIMVNIIMKL